MEKEKVFCSECTYYDAGCLHPDNILYKDTPVFRNIKQKKRCNREINKDNDCGWFKKIEEKIVDPGRCVKYD